MCADRIEGIPRLVGCSPVLMVIGASSGVAVAVGDVAKEIANQQLVVNAALQLITSCKAIHLHSTSCWCSTK